MNDTEERHDVLESADAVLARRTHDRKDGHIAATTADAIAEAVGDDPTELTPTLYDYVDPAALDALFGPRDDGVDRETDGHVSFRYDGYEVVVTSDGDVIVGE